MHEQWMDEAAAAARNALCKKARCGAVIVKDDRIIGRGYNAPPLDDEANRMCDADRTRGEPKYDKTCCIHAEWRAILDALRNHPDQIEGSTLYFVRIGTDGNPVPAGQPFCTVCSRLTLDAGVAQFALWHADGIRVYAADEYNRRSYAYGRLPLEISYDPVYTDATH